MVKTPAGTTHACDATSQMLKGVVSAKKSKQNTKSDAPHIALVYDEIHGLLRPRLEHDSLKALQLSDWLARRRRVPKVDLHDLATFPAPGVLD